MTKERQFTPLDVTSLRRSVPALRIAERAVGERVEAMGGRMEPHGLQVWEDASDDLQALRKTIEAGEHTDEVA